MSVSSLSQTLQQRILNNLITNVQKDIAKATALKPGKRFGSTFIATEVTTANMTRIITDPNQTGIFGATGLKELATGFNNIAKGLSKVGSRVLDKNGKISKQAGYKNLKKYLEESIKSGTKEGIEESVSLQNAIKVLAQKANTELSRENLYNDFLLYVENKQELSSKVEKSTNAFTVSGLQHGYINKLFDGYLLNDVKLPPELVEFISANTDAGHLLGIFNQKLFRAFGAVADNNYDLGELSVDVLSNIEKNIQEDVAALNRLNSTFSAAFNLMESIDFLSSSIKSTPGIFVKLSKEVYTKPDSPQSAAEIQLSIDNGQTGDLLKDAGKKLENLIKSAQSAKYISIPGTTEQVRDPKSAKFAEQLEDLFKQIGTIAEVAKQMGQAIQATENKVLENYVKKIVAQADVFADILLNAEGSDSVLKAAVNRVVSRITKKRLPAPGDTTVSRQSVAKSKKPSVKNSGIKSIPITKSGKPELKTPKRVRRQEALPAQTNLTSLLSLLNANLSQKIKENMGDGTRRDILNLRTGRLAESVKVERLSESRAGMITAFYSYMKNPYATFSEGGAQSSPRSRDPKLLISKSIREIAQQQVANRLRAVVV